MPNRFRVEDNYRINPLSTKPGGVEVEVHYNDGSVRVYDKIKNVEHYAKYILKSEPTAWKVTFNNTIIAQR